MAIKQNQTNPAWLDANEPDKKGTGIFALANIQSEEPNAVTLEAVRDITYDSCVKRGALTVAYQWVPQNIPINIQPPGAGCAGEFCVDTCAPGCLCIEHICVPILSLP